MIRFAGSVFAVLKSVLLLVFAVLAQATYAQTPAGTLTVLTGARLFDGTGSAPIEQSIVVIRDGRIEAVGAASSMTVPADAVHVDLSGKTILPGLINAHGHLNTVMPAATPGRDNLLAQLRLYASYGVTTVVVLGIGEEDLGAALQLRDEQQAGGALDGARLLVAGPSLQNIATAAEARTRVNAYADAGVDIVKIHVTGGPNDMTPEVYGALIDQAHSHGLDVAAHVYYLADARGLVNSGVDVLAHSVRDQDLDAALIAEIKRRNVGYIPTLTRDLARFVYETTPAFVSDPFFLRSVAAYRGELDRVTAPAYQAEMRNSEVRQADKVGLRQGSRNLKIASDAGISIGLGTDSGTNVGQWQGYFEHTELEMMVEAGMTPAQVLFAATGAAASMIELDQVLGTLQPGRWADLLVLDADPLSDIRATRQINSVWVAGKRLAPPP